ncbi:MAG: ROK family protein [Melioribacteraceae bacterium]|nr:ROK family protein [Melioribacteraceae bacterium]
MKNVTLGIDIGGTNTVFGIVDEKGKIIFKDSLPTNGMEPAESLFERVFQVFDEKFKKFAADYKLIGIGMGAPDGNYYTGSIENPPNLNWGYVNVANAMKKYYDIPFALTNDANAAAIGEMEFGSARGMKNFIQVTLGTGLGSGIVVDGKMLYGHSGVAGELGHINIVKDGRKCGCGNRGCLETYVSATGIIRTVFELLASSRDESSLRNISFNQLTAKQIYDAAMSGDKVAISAFKYTGKLLGEALADAVAILSPEAIVIFGGLAQAGEILFAPTRKNMESNLLHFHKGKIKLIKSGLEEGDAAILGASALIWQELKK